MKSGLVVRIFGVFGFVVGVAFATEVVVSIPTSETSINYQNAKMKACLTGKDPGGASNPAGYCPNSLIPSDTIPKRDGFAGTSIIDVGVFNTAGDRLDGFFDCKMKRVTAAVPTSANSPDACVRVRCGYMGSCSGGAPNCIQNDMGGIVCQMYSLRPDAAMANIGLVSTSPIPVAQINSGCTVTQSSFDCTTTAGYDATKTYYITGLDPVTCQPICTVAAAPANTTGKVWSRDAINDGTCTGGTKSEAYRCVDTGGCNADTPVIGLPAGPSGGTASISIPCSAPVCTELSNSGVSTPSPGTRTQSFAFTGTVSVGTKFSVMVYSHGVSVTAASGDTVTTMVSKLATAVNNTTLPQWNDAASNFTNTKPSATVTASDTIQLKLNYQNQFGCSATP